MKLARKLSNSVQRSGIVGTIVLCLRAAVFYVKEQTPSRRRARARERQRQAEVDHRYGIRTAGDINLAELEIPHESRVYGCGYQATSEVIFKQMLSALPDDLRDFVFIDFGSGMGGALLLASEYSFRAILGIEFAPALHEIACQNIHSYQSSTQKCRDIQSICGDAAEYVIPDSPAVFYFYNPFLDVIVARVLANIERSLHRTPRPAYIIYYNPQSRKSMDRSWAFSLIKETAAYCVYRTVVDMERAASPAEGVSSRGPLE